MATGSPGKYYVKHLAFATVLENQKYIEQPNEIWKPHQWCYINEAKCLTEFLNNIQLVIPVRAILVS